MDREMNFWDLCVACGRAVGRACVWLGTVAGKMIRLTWRYWYIVGTLVVLAVAAAVYRTRPQNIEYRVNAVAYLNGASISQFEQAFAPLQSCHLLPEDAAVKAYLRDRTLTDFALYRVVDVHHDEVADYIDFKRNSSPKDTTEVQMQDRVCIQFHTRAHSIHLIPEMEKAVLDYLNSNEALQQSYLVYLENLKEAVAFNHRQAVKLDSLTSVYYYNAGTPATMVNGDGSGVNFYGDRRIRLFLNDIYRQQLHTQLGDLRLQMAAQPVVLENHFAVDPAPVMTRTKMVVLYFLLGWLCGGIIALIVEQRKKIVEWLKA